MEGFFRSFQIRTAIPWTRIIYPTVGILTYNMPHPAAAKMIFPDRGENMNCPLCGTINTGKVGTSQYYCWRCLVEFTMNGQDFTAYYVDEEGALVLLSDLASGVTALNKENIYG